MSYFLSLFGKREEMEGVQRVTLMNSISLKRVNLINLKEKTNPINLKKKTNPINLKGLISAYNMNKLKCSTQQWSPKR